MLDNLTGSEGLPSPDLIRDLRTLSTLDAGDIASIADVFADLPEGTLDQLKQVLDRAKKREDTEVGPESTGPAPSEAAFLREHAAFEQCLPQLLQRSPGSFAAFYGGRLVDEDVDELALAGRMEQAHRDEFVLIRRISTASSEDHFDSPESETP